MQRPRHRNVVRHQATSCGLSAVMTEAS